MGSRRAGGLAVYSLRGRRLKGKGKGALGKGVLGARETPKTPFPKTPFPFPFKRQPRRLGGVRSRDYQIFWDG